MSVNWKEPIQTRDGCKAEFVKELKMDSTFSMLCIVEDHSGLDAVRYLSKQGKVHMGAQSRHDIINVPEEPKWFWMLVFPPWSTSSITFVSREAAETEASKYTLQNPLIARVPKNDVAAKIMADFEANH